MATLESRLVSALQAIGLDVKSIFNRLTTPPVFNASVANQSGFSADTYLTGSTCLIPASGVKVGTQYRCIFDVVKTAAGVAAPIINVRFGISGTTADTSRGTFTFSAQTAAADQGMFEIRVSFRANGSVAIIQSLAQLKHRSSITGLGIGVSEPEIDTSTAFNSTVANSIIGISVNAGASAAWTVSLAQAELVNLA